MGGNAEDGADQQTTARRDGRRCCEGDRVNSLARTSMGSHFAETVGASVEAACM
jgi:hypothetical protein